MSVLEDQAEFYRERVPEQFNRTLAAQREAALDNPEADRVLAEMTAVRASIVVQVDTGDQRLQHAFDIDRGEMHVVAEPTRPPFLVLGHRLADFASLRRECGDSLLGFLGGLAGLGDEMRLTSQRIRSLRELAGGLVFERVGPNGFALTAHFGEGDLTPEPRATIRIEAETYAELQAGMLDPQDAFLSGRVEISGDEGMAINLALAALSPD